jgi:hypothetical protein
MGGTQRIITTSRYESNRIKLAKHALGWSILVLSG